MVINGHVINGDNESIINGKKGKGKYSIKY